MTAPTPHPRYWADRNPDAAAFVLADSGLRRTYAELVERADRAARLYSGLGIEAGDTIAIFVENHVCFPELVWAAKNSGLRYVAVSTHLNSADAAYIIQDSGARLLITSRKMAATAAESLAALTQPIALLMLDGAEPPFLDYDALVLQMPAAPLPDRFRGASMLYSSGTTGRPKGVETPLADVPPTTPPQRHATIVRQYGLGVDTVFISPGPLYHAGPLRFMMTVQRNGGAFVANKNFDAAQVLAGIGDHGATHGFFVPTMFSRFLRLPEAIRAAARTATMRHAIHGAAPCPMEVKRAMIAWWGPVIDELYSGTEAVGHTFISAREWLEHPGSVGRATAPTRIKIVDHAGRELPPGRAGRIMMSNGLRFAYHGDGAKTRAAYDEAGFSTLGDVGYLDAEGYLYLTDRESHMIISGGVNIYPQEAETVLSAHPAVEDVAVIGVPHPDMGEEVKAIIQPTAPPNDAEALAIELLAYCRERLSSIKCPRSIDFVESLPRNAMGKLAKHLVKAKYWPDPDRPI